jgi:hypothetical protein
MCADGSRADDECDAHAYCWRAFGSAGTGSFPAEKIIKAWRQLDGPNIRDAGWGA